MARGPAQGNQDHTATITTATCPASRTATDAREQEEQEDARRWKFNKRIALAGLIVAVATAGIGYWQIARAGDNGNRTQIATGTGDGANTVANDGGVTVIVGMAPVQSPERAATASALTYNYHGGWGPARRLFTWKDPAPFPSLNSITDVPDYGDARNFVRIKLSTQPDSAYTDILRATPGDLLDVYVWVDNDCANSVPHEYSTIHGLAAHLQNFQVGKDLSFSIQLDADNAKSVWNGASVITDVPSRLVNASEKILMHTIDAIYPLDATDFAGSGMKIGQLQQDGEFPVGKSPANGGEQGTGYFVFQLRVESQ